jgi:2,3-dihydro-2,3-dihydroxybenzoate dehydrogenase
MTTVVVGAGRGIGEAVARRLVTEPWAGKVVLADILVDETTTVAADLATAGHDVEALQVDLRSDASIADLVGRTSEADKVCIVSGIFKADSSLEVTRAEFERILSVNLLGVFMVAQGYARHMVERESGSIVAIGSIASRMPRLRQAAYTASKAGMRLALRSLALETVPRGVRINFVAPGPADTEMMRALQKDHAMDDLWKGSPDGFRPPIPDRRVAKPEDIAGAVAFLLSPDAAHIAFHDLFVDGGESLGL